MQVRAIMEAACEMKKQKIRIFPEIMIPLIGTVKELTILKKNAINIIHQVFKEKKTKVNYLIGTMIEVPRAAITADKIAAEADFFSFGTNDLTQMGCGFSRDDSGSFLGEYVEQGIFEKDPFVTLDTEGIGQLVSMGETKGRSVRKDLKIGICGEHGGDPDSITFCHRIGMDYVSCSHYRDPIARLAAAQAAINSSPKKQ